MESSENELEKNTRKKKLSKNTKADTSEFPTIEVEEDEVDTAKSSTTENEQNTLDIELPTEEKEYGVLVIDDQIPWHSLYKYNLVRDTQYKFKFYTTKSTTGGIQLMAENYGDIDVVILDLNMPRKNGINFLETAIGELGIENFAVFVVTSYGTEEAIKECMFYGVKGFYDKDTINFVELSEDIIRYIDFLNRKKAIEIGIYVENRYNELQDKNLLYFRWFKDGTSSQNPRILYLGETNKIKKLQIPVKSDLSPINEFFEQEENNEDEEE